MPHIHWDIPGLATAPTPVLAVLVALSFLMRDDGTAQVSLLATVALALPTISRLVFAREVGAMMGAEVTTFVGALIASIDTTAGTR